MTVKAVGSTSVSLPLDDVWNITVQVRDADCNAVDSVPVVTVTPPSGSDETPVVDTVTTGEYRVLYTVTEGGRYVAHVVAADYGAVDMTAWVVSGPVTGTWFPDVDDLDDYLGGADAHSYTDAELQGALDAEAQAQRDRCKIPATYPFSLREALLRRCARNLAMRRIPLAVPQGDAESGPTIIPGNDPEVRRLEAPYRRRKFG